MEQNNDKDSLQNNQVTNIRMMQTNTIMPSQISATICVNNVTSTQIYVSSELYEKLLEEKKKLETQVEALQNQINESAKMRQELQNKLDDLNKYINKLNIEMAELRTEIQDLKSENVVLNQIKTEYDQIKIYQKVSDNLNEIVGSMYDSFCNEHSIIRKRSCDTDLYNLSRHLNEYCTKNYSRRSKVKDNLENWSYIYNDMMSILKEDFNIEDINVFFEIIRIKDNRNSYSHSFDKVTLEEIKYISQYAQQIFECINLK